MFDYFVGLPKTRSGKIMRRVLRKIATKEEKELGDLSTLADPEVVKQLIGSRPVSFLCSLGSLDFSLLP